MPPRRRRSSAVPASVEVLSNILKEALRLTDEEAANPDVVRTKLSERLDRVAERDADRDTRAAPTRSASSDGSCRVSAERIKVPMPEYYGFQDARTPKDFLEELQRYGRAQGFTSASLLERIVPAALKGVAARWWTFMGGFNSWNDFEIGLQTEYGPPDYRDALLIELESRTQHPDEPLSAFIQAIAGYYDRIGGTYSEGEKVERVLKQMHPEFRRIIGDEKFNTLREFSTAATKFQRTIVRERAYRPPPPAHQSIEPTLAWPRPRDEPGLYERGRGLRVHEAYVSYAAGTDESRLTMAALDPFRYNRRERGGVDYDVSSPQLPNYYAPDNIENRRNRKRAVETNTKNGEKRIKKEGWNEASNSRPERACWGCGCMLLESGKIPQPRDPPLVKTRIEGYYYLALIDTGASASFLGDVVIRRLAEKRVEVQPSDVEVELASGRVSGGGRVMLEISWSGGRLTQQFILLPGSQCAVILGRDFIIATKMSIDLSRGGWMKPSEVNVVRLFDNSETHVAFVTEQNTDADAVEAILEREAPTVAVREIRNVLRRHERLFSKRPGHTSLVQHRIDTRNNPPVRCRMRPLNANKRTLLEREVQKLLNDDIIEECSSAWASPPVLVAKKNGGIRLCVDMRAVNKISNVIPYVMPTAEWIFSQLGHARYFSSIDIAQGYHQISLHISDRDKSSFIVGSKQYRYKRLPFGLAGSGGALSTLTALALPDMTKPFIIQCDACREGLGAALMQEDADGRRRPIAFASRLLAQRESRYNISELECLAVVWATSKFSHYVEMSEFIIETDHSALKNILTIDEPTGRIRRWAMRLMGQRCKITYRKGSHIKAADALSRAATENEGEGQQRLVDTILPLNEPSEGENRMKFLVADTQTQTSDRGQGEETGPEQLETLAVCGVGSSVEPLLDMGDRKMWRDAQDQDAVTREHKRGAERDAEAIEKGKDVGSNYVIESDGMLVRYLPKYSATRSGNDDDCPFKIVVPSTLRCKVMRAYHNHVLSSHLGVRKSLIRIQRFFTWAGMRKDVKAYIAGCVACQTIKPRNKQKAGFMDSRVATRPGESASCDVIGPLPMTSDKKRFIFVVIDDFTKFVELYPLGTSTGPKITHCLIDYCCRYGFMTSLRSDGGRQFVSKIYNAMCDALKIKPRRITPYRPQGNNCEIANKAIKTCIKMYAKYHKEW
ncbi:hypothetical protein B566_EDAN006140, partial [Ephemera danica]